MTVNEQDGLLAIVHSNVLLLSLRGEKNVEAMRIALNRALNCWPEAPPAIWELSRLLDAALMPPA